MKLLRVRALIDAVDHAIVVLLAKRATLVRHAFRSKAGQPLIDPEREAAMMRTRRGWAKEAGLSPDAVEDAFKAILLATRPPPRA
jgi:chorismate mutase